MVRKIVSSIIIIMMICSFTFVCATEPSDETLGESTQIPEDTDKGETTVLESGNQNTDNNKENNSSSNTTKPEEDNSTGNNNQGDNVEDITPGDNDNTNQIPDSDNKTDNESNNDNNGNEGNNTGDNNQGNNGNNNTQNPEQQEPEKQNPNNSGSSNNNYVQPKSSEARLKDLKLDVEGVTPNFDKNTTEYYLIVDLSINKINVSASTVDNKAKWAVYGNKNLKEGDNTITINVTAEDGTEKKYYIYVTKIDDVELANAELEALEVNGFNFYPTFKSNIYSYNLHINKDISNLDITAKPQREKATVQIEGNTNLQEGENSIEIKVTAEDETTVRTYKINTFIDSKRVEIKEEDKTPVIVLIVILGVSIIGLGIFIVTKNRR